MRLDLSVAIVVMAMSTAIVPMDVDSDALTPGWMALMDRLVANEKLFDSRMINYQRCATTGVQGPDGMWSEDVLEKVLAAVRSRGVPWAVRPPLELCPAPHYRPAALTSGEEREGFVWGLG